MPTLYIAAQNRSTTLYDEVVKMDVPDPEMAVVELVNALGNMFGISQPEYCLYVVETVEREFNIPCDCGRNCPNMSISFSYDNTYDLVVAYVA